ncbi:UPF0692 protein CG33108 [Drosophila busckii]|uniref:UPF0692 protein CG33108 n=1 Tax=Drosophila busckii TaxID=30019 RepID=UPI00083EC640|nr:UPF0692 protein CG33108 [Drosophila busckii]
MPAAPPPPPPLPSCVKCCPTATTTTTVKKCQLNDATFSQGGWAKEHPDILKACFLARVCERGIPKKCQYRDIRSIIQVGPTCGLTALSMILDGSPSAGELLADAVELKYTLNGEMFSGHNLHKLTNKHLKIGSCQLHEGAINCTNIREHILSGGCLLVAYDAAVNHEPCLKKGRSAHWALILGYLIDTEDEFHVVARHGKTRNLAVWSLAALSESNANLLEFVTPKGYTDCEFLLPDGGIAGPLGLNERCILLHELPQEIIKLH